ncbi:DNA polymerase, partial [Parvimonas micra]
VHADFKLIGTQTGRLAGAAPNLLNQPRGEMIRSQFVAGEGKIFGEIDLNQAELRSLALMSGDPVLTEIYTKNEVSIHDVTTGAFFAPKAEVMKGEQAYERVRMQLHLPVGTEPSFVYGQAKMRGKAVNFGIVYG